MPTNAKTDIRLFQADVTCPFVFRPLDDALKIDPNGVSNAHYTRVYSESVDRSAGQTDAEILEWLYAKLNRDDRPGAQKFRSMSVSDVVELSEDGANHRCYYCDMLGFKPVTFDSLSI